MELTNTLKKGIILDTFNILSVTAALILSLFVYAMHDYFNLFGVKHAIVFTILIFYGLAATGYYFLCFKESNSYKMPTVGTRIISLVFYTSIGIAVFFAYKIYINSPLDYIIAFFAGCILGALIKDVTAFAVYANKSDDRVFDLLDITANLPVLSISYFLYQFKSGVIDDFYFGGLVFVIFLVNAFYISARTKILDKWDVLGLTFLLSCIFSVMNVAIFYCINGVIYSIYFNLELALVLMAIYLYLSNILIRKIVD